MASLYNILTLDVWQSILWVLAHTLWQATAIAGLLCLLLKLLPIRYSNGRYWLSLACLLAVVLAGLATWTIMQLPEKSAPQASINPMPEGIAKYAVDTPVPSPSAPPHVETQAQNTSEYDPRGIIAPSIVSIWFLGVLAMLLRIAFSWCNAQRLIEAGTPLEDPNLTERIQTLKAQLQLPGPLSVLVLEQLQVPSVIGLVKPTLLLPLAFLNEISMDQAEVVLAHELAHIRRHDMVFTLFQRITEALLFFNPAAWWISHQISLEREACCDTTAVALTGTREHVAKALLDVVTQLHQPSPSLHAALALHRNNRQGHFTERLRRLLEPATQSRLHLPIASFILLIAMTGLGLLLLHWGTSHAVLVAAELLSPQQHIEQMEQTQKDYGIPEDPAATTSQGKILVRGTIRSFDNAPLPEDLYVELIGHMARGGIACYTADLKDGVFQSEVRENRMSAFAFSQDYAPLFAGPFKAEFGQTLDNLELVLQPGFKAQIQLKAPSGDPIRGADVSYAYPHKNATYRSDIVTSDNKGILTFPHAIDRPVSLTVRQAGYEFDVLKTKLSKDTPIVWTLSPAEATTGILVSQATGQPLPHVPIYLLSRRGFQNRVYDPRPDYNKKHCLLTHTDAQGRFTLDSLRQDCIYALYIDGTEHYGPDILSGITAGQQDLQLHVSPARYVQGRILGDYEPEQRRIKGRKGVPVLSYSNDLDYDDYGFGRGCFTPLYPLEDGTGWSFKIPNLLSSDVIIDLEGHPSRTIVKPTEAITDYTIDLRPEAVDQTPPAPPHRKVIVKLHPPQGWPIPTGKIRLDHVMPGRNGYKPYWVALENGQAELDVPMLSHGQGKFMYQSSKDLIGYWIEEKRAIPIPFDDEPLVIDVNAHPAGAIYGVVFGPDSTPMVLAGVDLTVVEESPMNTRHATTTDHSISVNHEGRFVFSPLPLGGTYQIKAYRMRDNERYLTFSEDIQVTRAHPTQSITLNLPEGKTLNGRVINRKGQGLRNAKVSLNYRHKHGSFSDSAITTDAQGYFEFTHVNTQAGCSYYYRVSSIDNYTGRDVPATLEGTQTITLREGLTVRGRVIDSKTGGLIPGAEITLSPYYDTKAVNKASLKTQSNARGEFTFKGLEAIEYSVWIEGAVHPDTLIQQNADGTTTYRNHKQHSLRGDRTRPIDIHVQLKPHSKLRPLPVQ